MSQLVRTEVIDEDEWADSIMIELPIMGVGRVFKLKFEHLEKGDIDSLYKVVKRLDKYEGNRGYSQFLSVERKE